MYYGGNLDVNMNPEQFNNNGLPTLMSTYGDRYVICLQRRCEWRGLQSKVMPLDQNATPTDLQTVDLLVGGGAQDRQQEIVMRLARRLWRCAKIDSGTPASLPAAHPNC